MMDTVPQHWLTSSQWHPISISHQWHLALCRVLTIIGDMDAKDRIIEEQRLLIEEQSRLIEELRREIEKFKLALAKASKDSSNSSKSPSSDIVKPPKRDARGKVARKRRKRGG